MGAGSRLLGCRGHGLCQAGLVPGLHPPAARVPAARSSRVGSLRPQRRHTQAREVPPASPRGWGKARRVHLYRRKRELEAEFYLHPFRGCFLSTYCVWSAGCRASRPGRENLEDCFAIYVQTNELFTALARTRAHTCACCRAAAGPASERLQQSSVVEIPPRSAAPRLRADLSQQSSVPGELGTWGPPVTALGGGGRLGTGGSRSSGLLTQELLWTGLGSTLDACQPLGLDRRPPSGRRCRE